MKKSLIFMPVGNGTSFIQMSPNAGESWRVISAFGAWTGAAATVDTIAAILQQTPNILYQVSSNTAIAAAGNWCAAIGTSPTTGVPLDLNANVVIGIPDISFQFSCRFAVAGTGGPPAVVIQFCLVEITHL